MIVTLQGETMAFDIYQVGDTALPPGEARCPGPSPKDIITAETDAPSSALLAERYEYLGSDDIAFERYTSQAFFDAEMERMWSRTWQWACREEHIPDSGDYHVYDVGPYSVIVIRDDAAAIRAYVNSCPHRGMQFCPAGEQGSGKQFLRCPFHGMSWHLDGSLREIPCRWDFPHIDEDTFRLTEVPCDTWGGFVFINLDRDAEPLNDYLEVLPEHFKNWGMENRFVALHMEKKLYGNWKMVMEGFLEAFHVLATHPEGLRTSGWANTQYDIFGRHVTRFLQTLASGNPHHHQELSEPELFEALGHRAEDLPEGTAARQAHADGLRVKLGASIGVDLSGYSNSEMLDSIEYHVFPNACFFPGIVIPLVYRFRPLSVDTCIHEILLLQPVPDNGTRPPPAEVVRLDVDDSYATAKGFEANMLAHVLDQDTENFKMQHAGIKASQKTGQTLGNYQEARIRRFHKTLDEYLAR
jgi:phenylpropionate dioxygenase-like ring-hydroxylating dioxygenase large terminal subunit